MTFPSPFYTCACISGCVECLVHHQSFSICPPPGPQRPLFPFLPASFLFVLETTMVSTESRSWFCCFVYECFASSFAQVIHRPYMSETIWLLISLPDSFDFAYTPPSHPIHGIPKVIFYGLILSIRNMVISQQTLFLFPESHHHIHTQWWSHIQHIVLSLQPNHLTSIISSQQAHCSHFRYENLDFPRWFLLCPRSLAFRCQPPLSLHCSHSSQQSRQR